MKLPLRFERLQEYVRAEEAGVRKLADHEGYMRENNGDWVILDADGVGVITIRFQGKAKRGQTWNAPDPEGMKMARMIVDAVNEKFGGRP